MHFSGTKPPGQLIPGIAFLKYIQEIRTHIKATLKTCDQDEILENRLGDKKKAFIGHLREFPLCLINLYNNTEISEFKYI